MKNNINISYNSLINLTNIKIKFHNPLEPRFHKLVLTVNPIITLTKIDLSNFIITNQIFHIIIKSCQ